MIVSGSIQINWILFTLTPWIYSLKFLSTNSLANKADTSPLKAVLFIDNHSLRCLLSNQYFIPQAYVLRNRVLITLPFLIKDSKKFGIYHIESCKCAVYVSAWIHVQYMYRRGYRRAGQTLTVPCDWLYFTETQEYNYEADV